VEDIASAFSDPCSTSKTRNEFMFYLAISKPALHSALIKSQAIQAYLRIVQMPTKL